MKKVLLLLLAVLMVLLPLAGCKPKKTNPGETTDGTETTQPSDSTQDDLGDKKFTGEEFKVLARQETDYEYKGNEAGSLVDQAVYKRNEAVKNRLDISLNFVFTDGDWGKRSDFLTKCRAEVMGGGQDGYDLISTHSVYLGTLGTEGLALDLTTLPAINVEKEWWSKSSYEALSLNGHVFEMIGDVGYTIYEYMEAIFINETIFESINEDLEELYRLVDDGEWTYDKYFEYVAKYGNKGEGAEEAQFTYGLVTNIHALRASFMAQDSYVYQRDENGRYYLPDTIPDKLLNLLDRGMREYSKENVMFPAAGDWGDGQWGDSVFASGRALFYEQTVGTAQKFKESMSNRYGILPLPKYDALQEKYYSECRDTLTAVSVPTTAKSPEKSGYCTEALAMYGYQIIRPAYYDTVLKVRLVDGPRYGEILDTIRDGLTYGAVGTFTEKAFTQSMFIDNCFWGNKQPATVWAENIGWCRNELDAFYSTMEKRGILD